MSDGSAEPMDKGPGLREAIDRQGDPTLIELDNAGELYPERIEDLSDPGVLLSLTDAVTRHTKDVLLHWEPLLEPMKLGETTAPNREMTALARLLQALGVALADQIDRPDFEVALRRVRRALESVSRWLPEEEEEEEPKGKAKDHLVSSRYDLAPVQRGGTTGRKEKKGIDASMVSPTSLLSAALVTAVILVAGAHGLRVFLNRPVLYEFDLSEYQELVPEVLEKELVGGARMIFTVRNEWGDREIGIQVDDAMLLMEMSAVEGWRDFVVVDEGKRVLMRTGTRGELVVVRGPDVP